MHNRGRQRILLGFKSVIACCGSLAILIVVALILFIVNAIKDPNRQPTDELASQDTHQTIASVETDNQLSVVAITSQQAIINNAYCEGDDLADFAKDIDEIEFLNVYWLEDGTVQQASPTSAPVEVIDGRSYNFSLAVRVNRQTAQNVRAFIRVPNRLRLSETAQVEVLVLADNAAPYYDVIELRASDDVSTLETDRVSGLQLEYREGSAILRSNSLTDGTKLDYVALSTGQDGLLLGAEQMDGVIPAGNGGTCILSWTIDAVVIDGASEQNVKTEEEPTSTLWDMYSLEISKLENAPTGRSQSN